MLEELGGGAGGGVDTTDSNEQVYLRLVARQGLDPSILKQQLQQRLWQAVQERE